jgi:dinuclear metal center YbgI/SA1388 family protein
MPTIQDFCQFMEELAPEHLAEEWDNVGLLVGHREETVHKVMTCLTVTPESVDEAVDRGADLIVSHHPFPFRPLKRITADTSVGEMLLRLMRHQIAVYSPHTSYDSALCGINQCLAEGLGLANIQPLEPIREDPDGLGAGRFGNLRTTLGGLVDTVKGFLGIDGLHYVGDPTHSVSRVAVACGSAGQFLSAALRSECDALLVGETNFHTCLEARAHDLALVLPGHYASERFAVETLATVLSGEFSEVDVWVSDQESDPLVWS